MELAIRALRKNESKVDLALRAAFAAAIRSASDLAFEYGIPLATPGV
jgi:hypothetical protein